MSPSKKDTSKKGVLAKPEDFDTKDEAPEDISDLSLKRELQNAIEMMGPGTPHIKFTESSDADNEASISIETSDQTTILTKTHSSKTNSSKLDDTYSISEVYTPEKPFAETASSNFCVTSELSTIAYLESITKECDPTINREDAVERQPPPLQQSFTPLQCHHSCPHNCCNTCVCHKYPVNATLPRTTHQTEETSTVVKSKIYSWFRRKFNSQKHQNHSEKQPLEFYKMNMSVEKDHSPPRRVIFDLVDGIPKPHSTTVATNTFPKCAPTQESKKTQKKDSDGPPQQHKENKDFGVGTDKKKCRKSSNGRTAAAAKYLEDGNEPTRVDVYYFDHGNSAFLRTTDKTPFIKTEIIAETTEEFTKRFWAELFGTIHVGLSFVTSFFLQLLKFLLQGILRPMTVGVVQISSDYFFKPCLSVFFNAVVQPPLIFIYNIMTSLRDICDPFAEGIGYFIHEIATLISACRLVEIKPRNKCECDPMRKCDREKDSSAA